MSLTAQQRKMAQLLYALARSRGLPDERAREFAAAGMAESGLDPHADNPSTHAHGLYQLLSSGYRRRAQQLGGLDNPRANALAILPDYVRYWARHPRAQAGAAGRDVERSGEGAGFYSGPLGLLGKLGGGEATGPQPVRSAASPLSPRPAAAPDTRPALAQALLGQVGHEPNVMPIVNVLQARARAQAQAEVEGTVPAGAHAARGPAPVTPPGGPSSHHGGLAELLHEGVGGPTHSTGEHIHVASTNAQTMLALIALAQKLGLAVRENPYTDPVDGRHAPHSYHGRTFPGRYHGRRLGEAIDVSGPAMRRFYDLVRRRYGAP